MRPIEFLSSAEIEQIHCTSMRLLARVGVQFPDDEAIALFRKHGVKTDGHTVYPGERQVMEALAMAPPQFTICGRGPERNVTVGGGEPVFAPGYGAPFLVDPGVGRRAATMEDYHNLARLVHALPNQDLSGHLLVEPGDVPAHTAHLHMLYASIIHSDKPFIGSAEGARGARHTMEMASIVFGEDIRNQSVTLCLINSR